VSKVDHSSKVRQGNEATLRRLDRHLRGSDKTFRLLFAEHENIIHRAEFIREMADDRGFAEIDLNSIGPDFSDFEAQLFKAAPQHQAVHLFGVEDFEDEARSEWFRGWNYHRERIAEACPALVLLWLYPEHLTEFALGAPDMWAWRTSALEFGSPAELMAAPVALSPWEPKPAPANWRERLVEIEAYLERIANSETEASDEVVAGLEAERGRIYLRTGQMEAGRLALECARDLYEARGDEFQALEQRVRWAEVTHDSIETDQVLKIWREIADRGYEHIQGLGLGATQAFLEVLLSIVELRSDISPPNLLEVGDSILDLVDTLSTKRNPRGALRAALLESKVLIGKNRLDEATKLLERTLLPAAKQLGEDDLVVRVLTELGRVQILQGNNGAAIAVLGRATNIAKRIPDTYLAGLAQLAIARVLFSRGELGKCQLLLEADVLPVLEARSDRNRHAEGQILLLGAHLGRSSAARQTEVLREATELLSTMDDLIAQARVGNEIADLASSIRRSAVALEMRQITLRLESHLPPLLKTQILTGLARDHLALDEPETALSILQDRVLPLQESDVRGQAVTQAEIERILEIGEKASAILSPPAQEPNS
jgi:tetratricopeptide (TPR) repeat protein